MLTFHPLELVRRSQIAEDAVCLELRPPPDLETQYRFEAGQHLAVRARVGGRELRRTYSIVSEAGGPLRIGVRVQGTMSGYLAGALEIGGRLDALQPSGRFRPTLDPASGKRYVALAAGSGITPVLSIVATLLAAEPHSCVSVVYGNRSISRSMFVDDLLALKNRYLGRLSVAFVMSRESQDVELFNGRLDGARLRELARTEFDVSSIDEFFICGPGSMVKELTAALEDLGAPGKIHVERFAVDVPAGGRAAVPPIPISAGEGPEVSVTMDGRRRSFRVASRRTLLEAAEAAGLSLPFSCRAGVCSTCRAKITTGTVVMERNQALENWEVQAGFILCCQAHPTSEHLEISYDEK